MGQLHIILGLPKNSNAVDPVVLFCGRDGTAAEVAKVAALAADGWPCVEHIRGASGYRKQGAALVAPDMIAAGKELDEVIAANHDLKGEIDLLDVKVAEQKAQMDKDAASIAELLSARDAALRDATDLRKEREQAANSLKHAESRIALLEKELSSVKTETRNSSDKGESAASGAGSGDANSSTETLPPGSQGSGSAEQVSSSAPTTAPQKPAAAPKGMQQQAKGR